MLTTSAHHNLGRTELLLHIARLRAVNEQAPPSVQEDVAEPQLDQWL